MTMQMGKKARTNRRSTRDLVLNQTTISPNIRVTKNILNSITVKIRRNNPISNTRGVRSQRYLKQIARTLFRAFCPKENPGLHQTTWEASHATKRHLGQKDLSIPMRLLNSRLSRISTKGGKVHSQKEVTITISSSTKTCKAPSPHEPYQEGNRSKHHQQELLLTTPYLSPEHGQS